MDGGDITMDYEEEIQYRNAIMDRICTTGKATSAERQWLATHRLYNWHLGYPFLHSDMVRLEEKTVYSILVSLESKGYSGSIIPVFTVPLGKGKIVTTDQLFDLNGNGRAVRPIKMLGCMIDETNQTFEFQYMSQLGLIEVSFECEYFDKKQHLIIRKTSNAGDPSYSMIREDLADNKTLYRCKAPTEEGYDGLVFTLEWSIICEDHKL